MPRLTTAQVTRLPHSLGATKTGKRYKPFWIEVNGERVPMINSDYRVKRIQERADGIVKLGEKVATEIIDIY